MNVGIFEFGNGFCHLRVVERSGMIPAVLATDLEENPGQSTVNGVEALARAVAERVIGSDEYELILHHPQGPSPFTRVTFAEPDFNDPNWHGVEKSDLLARLQLTEVPALELTRAEKLRIQALRDQEQEQQRRQEESERASMQVVALDDLPPIDELGSHRYMRADWPVIAAAACAIVRSGIDPLDRASVRDAAEARVSGEDVSWLMSLFVDPIVVSLEKRLYINGRHRTQAMRQKGVKACVAHVEPGYVLPATGSS